MTNSKLKKGDTVKVLTGRDRGKTGKILEVSGKDGRVLVEGVAMITRHRRPRKSNEKGQKLSRPAFLPQSNLMLVCANCGKPSRISYKISDNGAKTRVCQKCQKAV